MPSLQFVYISSHYDPTVYELDSQSPLQIQRRKYKAQGAPEGPFVFPCACPSRRLRTVLIFGLSSFLLLPLPLPLPETRSWHFPFSRGQTAASGESEGSVQLAERWPLRAGVCVFSKAAPT